MAEKVEYKTQDNVQIVADYYAAAGSTKGVVLVHMMPATKESWRGLAERLVDNGYNVLAIDLRGHGESEGGDYQNFSPGQHQEYYKDLESAVEFLKRKHPDAQIYLGGASIGANIVLKYMAEHKKVEKGFALSAGLDYYGVRAIDYVPHISESQSILLVGSNDDGRKNGENCGEMAEQLFAAAATSKKQKIIYDIGGHGTNLFQTHPDLQQKLLDFLT